MPIDPGETAQVTAQATRAVRSQLRDEHAESGRIHNNHHNMDASLKHIILKASDSTYIFTHKNVFTGYMGS